MGNWKNLLDEIKEAGSTHDLIRRKYLKKLQERTGRNVIVYYSGWLQKEQLQRQGMPGFEINDQDKNGFMTAIHKLDRKKGLDLLLHTPGGSTAATESLVDYLRSMFGKDVRAVIPQIAMSAGTMVALSCREIVMGRHSSLGPIDPQIFGIPAHGVVEEFNRAANEIKVDQSRIFVWQPIIAKYSPTLIGEAEKAIKWSNEMVREWLKTGMFDGEENAEERANHIITQLGDHSLTMSHSRHISLETARGMGIKVSELETDNDFQGDVLSVHHACIHTLASTGAYKVIENHEGVAFISTIGQIVSAPLSS